MFCVAANIFAVMQTFTCPHRLNEYLAENKVSCLGQYKVLPVNILKIAILLSQVQHTSTEQLWISMIRVDTLHPSQEIFSHAGMFPGLNQY